MKVLCLLGCVYQCFDISKIYFSYKTSTNVRYESQTFFDMPGVTICYYKLEQFNDKLKIELDQKFGKFVSAKYLFVNNLTIHEQLNELGGDPKKLLDCFYRSTISSDLKCNSVKNYTKSFNVDTYCLTLFAQHDEKHSDKIFQLENSGNYLKTMIIFEMRKVKNKTIAEGDVIFVKLHDRRERNKMAFTQGTLLISQEIHDYIYIKYQKTVVKYLFNPKLKPCSVGQTADECINNCRIKEFIDSTGMFPGKYLYSVENYSDLKFSSFNECIAFNWSEKCSQLCGHNTDCYREYFISDYKEYDYTYSNPDKFDVGIEFPTHPTTIYEISLKMSFEEYLCLIASIVSLWFGFSILSFVDFIQIVFNRLIVQYKCKVQTDNTLVLVSSVNRTKHIRFKQHKRPLF